ncbi:YtxH domain-containing protein [Vagococcus intermedius]|uniref:YtxH domain-containing protein n=1 Tax=Vagococcus intermedius TaxID=2991418 RepID=A0AAF0CW08_9ENTE|nr:YtxH domain-containing protein [Vagococcus intermedius]WEG74043.1 YtxH domain-containing protein [Vagococcus intermedius]WEG76123.1 YtxH domain-containing protein [Vagococcus intermedius]
MSKKTGGFLLGTIIGGAAAAAAALLLAPKAGKDLRQDLVERTDDFKNRAYDYNGSDLKDKASGFATDVKDKAVQKSDEALSSLKKQTADLSTKLKKSTENLVETGVDKGLDTAANVLEGTEDIILDMADMAEEIKQNSHEIQEPIEDLSDEPIVDDITDVDVDSLEQDIQEELEEALDHVVEETDVK